MSKIEQTDRPSLVRSFSQQSPSLGFVMRRTKRDGSVVEYPFRVRLLRAAQNFDVLAAAQAFAREKKEVEGYTDIYREAQAVELVQRVMLQDTPTPTPDGGETFLPYFVSGAQVRDSLDESEIAQVVNCYEITKAYFGFGSEVDEQSVAAVLDKLADEFSGPFFLSQFASLDWPQLIYTLARLATKQRSDPTYLDSLSTSESGPETSESGTSGFSTLPETHSESEPELSKMQVPTDRQLNRETARDLVKTAKKPKK